MLNDFREFLEGTYVPDWSENRVVIGYVTSKRVLRDRFGWENLRVDDQPMRVDAALSLWQLWFRG